jgi:hypothetical protein
MGKKILGYQKFMEKKLELSDLKDSPARGEVLVKKLRDKEDLSLDSGGTVKIGAMKDPDIDGAWVDPAVAVSNITDDSGEFDIKKASDYFKNTKPKDKRTNSFRTGTYVPVLKTDDGKELSLTNLKKDASFGSSGAGLRIREHESIQMVFLAKRLSQGSDFPAPVASSGRNKTAYDYPKIREIMEQLVRKNLNEIGNVKLYLAPGFQISEEMADYYCSDSSWLSTFSNVPNKLVSERDAKGFEILRPNLGYSIYHVSSKDPSSIPNVIFEKFKMLSKTKKNEATHFSRLPYPEDAARYERPFDRASREEIEFSKYCPADIYIAETAAVKDLAEGIKACKDIFELSTYLNDSFNDRQLIPVSLKRVGPSPKSAQIIVNAQEGMALPSFDVSSFRLSSDVNKGIGSKIMTDSEWSYKGNKIERQRNLTIDSPNTRKNNNVDAEIDGVWARHGKISLLWIKKFIELSDAYQKIAASEDIRIMEWQELQKLDIAQLEALLSKVRKDIEDLESQIEIDIKFDLSGDSISGSEKKLISKIQSMQVIRALAAIDRYDGKEGEEVDNIVTKMLLYALSIQNPGFSSPKYARVI